MSGPILPGATLGVMGGGQLGRMFIHAAQRMGYFTAVLDPDAASPAGRVSHHHIQTGYLDAPGLGQLAETCDAITTEFENVPSSALARLAVYTTVSPAASAVAIAQDRAAEKAHFVRCGVPCAPYAVIDTPEQLAAVDEALLPGILKTTRLGYDGKGQARVADRAALAAAWADMKNVPCVLEKMLPLAAECSVIVARGADGQMVHLPPQRNLHRDGILAVTEVYKENMPLLLMEQAVGAAKSIANELQYVGVLCVEFFVLQDGSLVVNEIAPRPHNSGHASMDCCDVSQFELQVRRRPVADGRAAGGGDGAVGLERRFQRRDFVQADLARRFIGGDLDTFGQHRGDLCRKRTRGYRRLRPLHAGGGKRVLRRTGKAVLRRTVFAKATHGAARLVGIFQAVEHHVVQHLAPTDADAAAPLVQQVRRIRHALHAARHHQIVAARQQHVVRQHGGEHARSAHLGQRDRPRALPQPALEPRLPRRCLPLPGHQAVAEHHLVNPRRVHPRARHRCLDSRPAQFVRRQGSKRPLERAHGGAGGGEDDDGVGGGHKRLLWGPLYACWRGGEILWIS